MADKEDDAGKPAEVDAPDPNPEKVEAANITFEGKEVIGKGDLLTELAGIVLEKLGDDFVPEDEETARNRLAALHQAVTDIDAFRAKGGEGDLHLALSEAGHLVHLDPEPPAPVEAPVEGDPFAEHVAEMIVPANPEDPGGDAASADPDPLVAGRIIEMPSSKNGADAYCKLLDAASDSYSKFSDALKEAIEDDAFTTDESPYPPLFNGGDWLAIHDKNGNFVLIYIRNFDGKYQTELTAFDPDITSCTVSAKHLGLATEADVTLLLIPMYNEAAGGCGDACASGTADDITNFSGYIPGNWSIGNDATDKCGFKFTVVEHVYVSAGGTYLGSDYDYTLGQWLREIRVDSCGTLVSISNRKYSIDDDFNIDTDVVPLNAVDYMWQDQT